MPSATSPAGHNIGENTSRAVRHAVYFPIKRVGQDPRWCEFLQDPGLITMPSASVRGNAAMAGNTTPCDSLAPKAAISPPLPRAGSPLVAV